MSSEEAQEEPAKVQEGGEPDPLTVVLDRLETINLTLFQIDQRLQEVEKPPLPRSDSKELDSRRNSHDGLNISQSIRHLGIASTTKDFQVRKVRLFSSQSFKRSHLLSRTDHTIQNIRSKIHSMIPISVCHSSTR